MRTGIISDIDGENISVRVQCQSACSHCGQRSICPIESVTKTVIIKTPTPHKHFIGEKVELSLSRFSIILCLTLAYGIPLLLLVGILTICVCLGYSETISGAVALASLLPYYLILFCINSKLRKHCQIKMTENPVD